jgi:hypothetical protein
MTRTRGRFFGRLVSQGDLEPFMRRPAARSQGLLDGVFADAVTLVEADTDKVAYQAAFELGPRATRRDIYFAPVGGVGGMAEPIKFYHKLHIPVAAIADLDLIMNQETFRTITEALTEETEAKELQADRKQAAAKLASLPPSITEADVHGRLQQLGSQRFEWATGDDAELVKRLRGLANQIDRLRRLKSGGIAALPVEPKEDVQVLVDRCATRGLFLVAVGELEHWSAELMKGGPSREKKPEWIAEFLKRLQTHPQHAKDIIDFVAAVGEFLIKNLDHPAPQTT